MAYVPTPIEISFLDQTFYNKKEANLINLEIAITVILLLIHLFN